MMSGTEIFYLTVAIFGFVAAGLMFFRSRRHSLSAPLAQLLEHTRERDFEITQREQRATLDRNALDLTGDAVIYLDGNRRITHLNKAARRLVTAEEGQPLIEAIRDHDLENLLRRSIAQGERQTGMVEVSRLGRVVRAEVQPFTDVGIVMVLRDETELLHLQKVRRELVANISHELRNPLNTLQVLIETLIEGAVDDPAARDYFLQKLNEQVGHLSGIVRESLHLASLESGEARLVLRPVPVRTLIERNVDRLLPQARRADTEMHTHVPEGLPAVLADFEQMSRALTNLLDNAVKWTPAGGHITICAQQAGGCVRFEVRDTGLGIPQSSLPRLFERFYKGDESRSGAGTGLGLAIAKHAVEMHGGRIWAESTEGEGASFFFTLPVADAPAAHYHP